MHKFFLPIYIVLGISLAGTVFFFLRPDSVGIYTRFSKTNIDGSTPLTILPFDGPEGPLRPSNGSLSKDSGVPAGEVVSEALQPVREKVSEDKESRPETIAAVFLRCRGTADFPKCLDDFFRGYFKINSTKTALKELDELQKRDLTIRVSCHEVVHAIGRETFAKEKTIPASFTACDQTCHSGCYHGAMERFLRGDESNTPAEERGHLSVKEVEDKIVEACPPEGPINLRFQCLHGLGHAAVFYFDYDLIKALAACDRLGSYWDRASCWGGEFMENVHAQYPEKRFLSKTDYHFPCSFLEQKYKSDCYVMQTTRMAEMGLSKEQIVEECLRAGTYRLFCLQSLGRDSSNDVRLGNGKSVASLCEKVGDEDGKSSCMRGAVYALADNTWDGRYVFPFCRDFTGEGDQRSCFQAGVNYLKSTLLVRKEKLSENCAALVANDSLCLAAVASFQ